MTEPTICTDSVPLLVTVAPPLVIADNVPFPEATEITVVIELLSTSATESTLLESTNAVSSLVVCVLGTVLIGASFTAVMLCAKATVADE